MMTTLQNLYEENKDKVIRKETSNPNMFVLKYKRSVFYDATWNHFLRECRGLVVDADWNIVALPFTKIHNYGIEKDAPAFDDEEMVFASRKVNGFMIAVTWYNNDLLWSTTGSLDSEFVGYARETFDSWTTRQQSAFRDIVRSLAGCTLMFECVHKSDPHIVHEEPGLYFIGLRQNFFGSHVNLGSTEFETEEWKNTGVKIVETWDLRFAELKEMAKVVYHEGFVFESKDGQRVSKIKSPHYLTKKALMRGNWEKFLQKNGRTELPEEFYGLHSYIQEVERERFFELDEIARREFIENWFKERNYV